MWKCIQVADDFYERPDRVRELALTKGKWAAPKQDGRFTYDTETYNFFYTESVVANFRRLVDRDIVVDPARMAFGVFGVFGSKSNTEFTTHYDETDWSAIVYLVPDDQCIGGLSFYRHRKSGLYGPPTDVQARELGCSDRADWLATHYYPDKFQSDAWIETTHVAMRFNRMILLRGSGLFHRASKGFGSSPGEGRLTQRFFFNNATKEATGA